MTSIKLMLTGAQAWASVSGPLTSGMVGIPVTIEYDEAWEGLTKNLVCRCSPWGSTNGEIRTILNVGENATVAHEVMQPDMYLHLGVEGFSNDGKLVMPTTWARCGKIEYGANTCDDLSTDPELPIWNQLQVEMEKTKEYVLTPEQAVNIQSYAQTATQAAQEAQQAAEEAKQTVESGLFYIPIVSQPTDTTLMFEFKPSITGVPVPKPVTVTLPEGSSDSGENVSTADVSSIKTVLGNIMTIINAQVEDSDGTPQGYNMDVSGLVAQNDTLIATLGSSGDSGDDGGDDSSGEDSGDTTEKTLTGISATYSGGSVAVGTAVSDLTGVVVTATYDDGSTATETGYTLSGSIAEGENTVTVTYQGMTTTFTVTGVAESDSEPLTSKEIASELEWVDGVNMWEGAFNEYAGMRTCKAYDVSGYNLLTIKSNGAHAAPTVGSVETADAATYTDIPNNEGSAYMGDSYPDTLTYNISGASLIRIKLNSNATPYSYVLS